MSKLTPKQVVFKIQNVHDGIIIDRRKYVGVRLMYIEIVAFYRVLVLSYR